jgi:hypothetical protein
MKIRSVTHDNRKKIFEVRTATKKLVFPFFRASPAPAAQDPITKLCLDAEVGREAFTYVLHSGQTGTSTSIRCSNTARTRPTSGIFC